MKMCWLGLFSIFSIFCSELRWHDHTHMNRNVPVPCLIQIAATATKFEDDLRNVSVKGNPLSWELVYGQHMECHMHQICLTLPSIMLA